MTKLSVFSTFFTGAARVKNEYSLYFYAFCAYFVGARSSRSHKSKRAANCPRICY